jgi:hypothetical protein
MKASNCDFSFADWTLNNAYKVGEKFLYFMARHPSISAKIPARELK